jgi:hypothetical protein
MRPLFPQESTLCPSPRTGELADLAKLLFQSLSCGSAALDGSLFQWFLFLISFISVNQW